MKQQYFLLSLMLFCYTNFLEALNIQVAFQIIDDAGRPMNIRAALDIPDENLIESLRLRIADYQRGIREFDEPANIQDRVFQALTRAFLAESQRVLAALEAGVPAAEIQPAPGVVPAAVAAPAPALAEPVEAIPAPVAAAQPAVVPAVQAPAEQEERKVFFERQKRGKSKKKVY